MRPARTVNFLYEILSSHGGGPRRTDITMASRTPLYLPTYPLTAQSTQEGHSTMSGSPTSGPLVATQTVVLDNSATRPRTPLASSPVDQHLTSGSHSSSSASQAPIDCLEVEQSLLAKLGLSAEVISMILASRRPSTIRIYGYTWRVFSKWCAARNMDPVSSSDKAVLEFL